MKRVEVPNARPNGESRVRTLAYANFDSNTDKLVHVFTFISLGVERFSDELKTKIASEIANLGNPQDKEASDQVTEGGAQSEDRVKRRLEKLVEIGESVSGGLTAIREWVPVMLVTAVEAYLKDVLVYAANVDVAIMKSSEQSASYAEVTRARSLEELTEELRSRWARNFVDDGGPDRWIKKLTRMGARGYRSQAANEMETLWGVRHLIVHSAGVATLDFVRHHPEIGANTGESIRLNSDQLHAWIDVVYHFVDVTDFYFVQRYGPRTVLAT